MCSLATNRQAIKIYREQICDMLESSRSYPTKVPRMIGKVYVLIPWGTEGPLVVEPQSINIQRGVGPILSQLPGEIRNIIYSHLLSAGHLQFLRASKALYHEGSGMVPENGIFRLGFGFPNSMNYSLPSRRVFDTIRNLDFRANLRHNEKDPEMVDEPADLWLLREFWWTRLVRGQCNLFFEVDPFTTHLCVTTICESLRMLSRFEKVVVRAKIDWPEPDSSISAPRGSVLNSAIKIWSERCKLGPARWSDFKYQMFYDVLPLDKNLGTGRLEQDEGGFRQVFHPCKRREDVRNV